MTALTDRLSRNVAKTLEKYGIDLTLTQKGQPSYDPSTSVATTVDVQTSVKGFPEPYRQGTSDRGDTEEDQDVTINKRKVTIDAVDLATPPLPGDTIGPIEGATWTVFGVTPTSIQGVTLIYRLLVKR